MRLAEGKDCLMVFDFGQRQSVQYAPVPAPSCSGLKNYHAGGLTLAPGDSGGAEEGLYAKGEKPDALIDWPVDATDYELVDIFN